MATIDTRILPLIETLATGDADWLAFEILDGLRRGRVAEETREDLKITQDLVRSRERIARKDESPASPPPAPEPIIGDEQIDWVVDYVSERILDIQSVVEVTLGQLDAILTAGSPDVSPALAASGAGVTLVLQTGSEEYLTIRRDDAARARTVLPKLQDALSKWAESVRHSDNAI